MAYLLAQSTSLAAANWSDATGFADNAVLEIRSGGQTVTAGLDQSGLTEGITSLNIGSEFTGTIGGTAGPLKCDVDGSGTPYLRNAASGGTLYYQAAGDNNLCVKFIQSGAGSSYIVGGTVTTLEVNAGYVGVNDSTTLATVNVTGGTFEADTAVTTLNQWGGSVIAKKSVTTWTQWGGAAVFNSIAGSITTLSQGSAGGFDHRGGNIATATIAGNFTVARANHAATIGGTAATIVSTTANVVSTATGAAITWSNLAYIGAGFTGGGQGAPIP